MKKFIIVLLLAAAALISATTGTLSCYTAQSEFGIEIVSQYKK